MERNFNSLTEQVVAHLRSELEGGRWLDLMPGRRKLMAELGVSGGTVQLALDQLEREGWLASEGVGKRRRILRRAVSAAKNFSVSILLYEDGERAASHISSLIQQLREAGFNVNCAERSLVSLGMDARRVKRFVRKSEANAWIVVAGSAEVLQWFSTERFPAFALFGRMFQLPIAGTGPLFAPAVCSAVRRLHGLGHRRIVMITRENRRKPKPGHPEQAFLDELEALGIPTVAAYHLPDWESSPAGLRACLLRLFQVTPPTALLIDEAALFHAVRHHLAEHGLNVPGQVSLVALDPDPTYEWHLPTIAHIDYEMHQCVSRVVKWVKCVSLGKEDRRQRYTNARFIEGGTIGPAVC